MAVRGDSTLMDASSASGCDFPYGVFPSSKSLITGERRSTFGDFFFSLVLVGIWPGGNTITLPTSQRLDINQHSCRSSDNSVEEDQ